MIFFTSSYQQVNNRSGIRDSSSVFIWRKKGKQRTQDQPTLTTFRSCYKSVIETKERVEKLRDSQMKNLIDVMMKRHPTFVFDVLEEINQPISNDEDDVSAAVQKPSWCSCGNCREMPLVIENVCCRQLPASCHSKLAEFNLLILEPTQSYVQPIITVRTYLLCRQMTRQMIETSHTVTRLTDNVLWRNGYLGASNRRVIPSCCVWAIRDSFPSPHGHYTGFKSDRLSQCIYDFYDFCIHLF